MGVIVGKTMFWLYFIFALLLDHYKKIDILRGHFVPGAGEWGDARTFQQNVRTNGLNP